MNFEISQSQYEFLKKVDEICISLRTSEEKCYLEEVFNDKLIPKFATIGMMGCPVSQQYGGLGYDIITYLLAIERIGRESSSMRTFFSVHTSLGQLVLQGWATDEQKKKYLSSTTDGKSIMAFALTEPEAGSDPRSLKTRYEDKGSHYVLNGKKHWIGNGTFANIVTTYAKNSENGQISAFIVEMDTKGICAKEMKNKIGLISVKNAEIYFDNCEIRKENMLALPNKGLNVAYSALIDGRISVAAGSIGVMEDCLVESIMYSKYREQHGSVLAKKQLIQEHISRIEIAIESSRWLTYRAAQARQKLHDYVEQIKFEDEEWLHKLTTKNQTYSILRSEADRLAAIAKFHATNSAFESSNRAVQIFGSEGYKKTSRVAKHFLDSRATMIYEGANEVLELKIALEVLGQEYRSY